MRLKNILSITTIVLLASFNVYGGDKATFTAQGHIVGPRAERAYDVFGIVDLDSAVFNGSTVTCDLTGSLISEGLYKTDVGVTTKPGVLKHFHLTSESSISLIKPDSPDGDLAVVLHLYGDNSDGGLDRVFNLDYIHTGNGNFSLSKTPEFLFIDSDGNEVDIERDINSTIFQPDSKLLEMMIQWYSKADITADYIFADYGDWVMRITISGLDLFEEVNFTVTALEGNTIFPNNFSSVSNSKGVIIYEIPLLPSDGDVHQVTATRENGGTITTIFRR
ncbi:MAG: hypothetical protein V3V40_06170 [Nitrosomonadaceae bacterium]